MLTAANHATAIINTTEAKLAVQRKLTQNAKMEYFIIFMLTLISAIIVVVFRYYLKWKFLQLYSIIMDSWFMEIGSALAIISLILNIMFERMEFK